MGATEYANDRRNLGFQPHEVRVDQVAKGLAKKGAELAVPFGQLFVRTKNEPLPADPYSGIGLMFRILNYRREVAYRNTNPFNFTAT